MELNKDFEDLLHLLNSGHVRYLVVGAYAVIFHTEPRYTKDLDIWIDPTRKNAQKVYQALKSFGAPLQALTLEDLMNPKMVYQVGVEPNRIDVLMGIGKIPFQKAWKQKKVDHYGQEKMYILGLEDTIQAKKIAGRPQDQLDLEGLLLAKKMNKKKKL